LFFTILFAADS